MNSSRDGSCCVPGCLDKIFAKRMCEKHYNRWRRKGHTDLSIREKGTGTVSSIGYVEVMINGKMYLKHILIAEKALGKKLPSKAQVHHIDENKSNNDPTNLVVCQDQKYHRLIHKLTKKVKPRWKYMDYRWNRHQEEDYKAKRERPAIYPWEQ